MRHIPPSRSDFMPADITFRALFTNTRARLCSAVALCFFLFFILRVVPRARCLRTPPPGYYCRERQRGMCLGSVGSGLDPRQPHRWLESQSLFLSLAILFSSARGPPRHSLRRPPPPPPPPFADEDVSPCKQS